MGMKQFATFYAADRYLGIDVTRVQEVIRSQAITRTPLAADEIRGLINLRGQIVMAFDLRRRLGLPPLEDGASPMNVVIRTPDGLVSLLVDRIGDVLDVDSELFEEPPETLRGEARALIRGAYKLDGALLLELDTDRALEVADMRGVG
jgi:purine-binding chemotaxis protein CheW